MGIPTRVVIRDGLAIAAILLSLAAAAAQAQVLASYPICAVSAHATCASVQARLQPCPAQNVRVAFLQWAVAVHRAAASDAGVAVHTLKPVIEIPDGTDAGGADTRRLACSR